MLIYVIRHGETKANAEGYFQGQTDGKLLDSGIMLARETGLAFRGIVFDAAYTSPLSRAVLTARTFLDASGNDSLQLIEDERLLEIDMGVFEGKKFRPGEREVDEEQSRLFFEDPFAFTGFPGGEDAMQVCERTQAFLKELCQKDYERVLVSTHGFALRAMLNGLYDDSVDFWQGRVPYNCSVSKIGVDNTGMQLLLKDAIYYDKSYCIDRYASY